MEYNIYCDESCHLRRDKNNIMVLGGVYCPAKKAKDINAVIIDMKEDFGWNPHTELKWSKIAPSNVELFNQIIKYFFMNDDLFFRGYIARGKNELNVDDDYAYNEWYYKMYYRMLEFILDSNKFAKYNLYIDIKDTIGYSKVQKLQSYLNNHYHENIVQKSQLVQSDQIALIQLTDILIGALSYKSRKLSGSEPKLSIVNLIERLSGENLLSSVPYSKKKVNWFVWTPDTWR